MQYFVFYSYLSSLSFINVIPRSAESGFPAPALRILKCSKCSCCSRYFFNSLSPTPLWFDFEQYISYSAYKSLNTSPLYSGPILQHCFKNSSTVSLLIPFHCLTFSSISLVVGNSNLAFTNCYSLIYLLLISSFSSKLKEGTE